MRYGVLALQGAVSEHVSALESAVGKLGISAEVLQGAGTRGVEGVGWNYPAWRGEHYIVSFA